MASQWRFRLFMLFTAGSLLFLGVSPVAHAATYTLTTIPTRTQESNSPGVVLSLNVTGAASGITYKFTWTVTDPSGNARPAANQTVTPPSGTFVLTVAYPANFGTNINFVGNYTINVQQNNPTTIPSVATGRFLVGLTDNTYYTRTNVVSIKAQGYGNNSPLTVNISHAGTSAPGYPTTITTDGTGSLSTAWSIPATVPLGVWTVSLSGNPVKAIPDMQTFTVYAANVTITQIKVGQAVLQRTQTETFSFTGTYPNGTNVRSGTASLLLTESDGTTTVPLLASFNATSNTLQAAYSLRAGSEEGAWVVSLATGAFNDAFGNLGPTSNVVRGFTVQAAALVVSGSVPGRTLNVGDQVPLYATVAYPDGSQLTSGTVAVALSSNGTSIGNPIMLTYVQGQSNWAGVYTVKTTDPSGLWLVTITATDAYGNAGQETLSVIANVPPVTPPPAPPKPLDTFYFLLTALLVASGGSGFVILRRFNLAHESFDEFLNLTGGEIPRATTLLILGDAGSGTSTTGLELIYRHLSAGNHAGLLAYDAFPKEIERTMLGMGWDVPRYLNDGSFTILDCYSALAGNENASVRDPIDFTEISIRVSAMIEKAEAKPIMVLLDSVTPIFNSAQARTAVNFLRVLSAKVKNSQGILILTGTKGSIPEDVRSNVDNMVDGVVELYMARDGKSLIRTLAVKRLTGRKVSALPTEFDIVPGRGILFKKPRVPLKLLTPKRNASPTQ